MNILVVCNYGAYQNLSGSFIHAQAVAYAALGHQVRVLVLTPVGKRGWDRKLFFPPLLRREADGAEIYFLRFLSLSNYGKKGFNNASSIHALRARLSLVLDGFSPDVIHAHTLGLSPVGAFLKGRLNVPLAVTTHGSDTFLPFAKGQLAELKQLADQADHLVCVSTLLRRRLETCGVTTPMSVILNGFHIQHMVPNRDRAPVSMIPAGYLVTRKKANITIQAFATLKKRYPEATLDIIGSGEAQDRFQALCRELDLEDSVHFHGQLPNEETLTEMSKTCFFVIPSVNEGFGIVQLESMASGYITIVTEGEDIADLIVSGENGFLVPPNDPDAIVRVIEWCLANPIQASVIAKQGRRPFLKKCDAISYSVPGTPKILKIPPISLIQVGNLVPSKRVNVTIQAFASLRKHHPSANLMIIGGGPERIKLERLCEELSVKDAVTFTGTLTNADVLERMRAAAFFIMASSPEGFGIVYLEAMASGCITIGTEGEGIADLIVSGENGFLVPPDDPDAIVRVIEWCLAHPEESAAIAERGRNAAHELTWEKNAARYIQLFKALKERNTDS